MILRGSQSCQNQRNTFKIIALEWYFAYKCPVICHRPDWGSGESPLSQSCAIFAMVLDIYMLLKDKLQVYGTEKRSFKPPSITWKPIKPFGMSLFLLKIGKHYFARLAKFASTRPLGLILTHYNYVCGVNIRLQTTNGVMIFVKRKRSTMRSQ